MKLHSFKPIQISGLSAVEFKRLVAQLGHLGLTVTDTGKGSSVTGQNLAGDLNYDPSSETLTVELQQLPPLTTPGFFVGRLYDEILSIAGVDRGSPGA
jgi:hypothetical protein